MVVVAAIVGNSCMVSKPSLMRLVLAVVLAVNTTNKDSCRSGVAMCHTRGRTGEDKNKNSGCQAARHEALLAKG